MPTLPSVVLTAPDEDQPTSSIVGPSPAPSSSFSSPSTADIPRFFFPFGKPRSDDDDDRKNIQAR